MPAMQIQRHLLQFQSISGCDQGRAWMRELHWLSSIHENCRNLGSTMKGISNEFQAGLIQQTRIKQEQETERETFHASHTENGSEENLKWWSLSEVFILSQLRYHMWVQGESVTPNMAMISPVIILKCGDDIKYIGFLPWPQQSTTKWVT